MLSSALNTQNRSLMLDHLQLSIRLQIPTKRATH
jgi:hypothetical protein